jgi:hypothetical protein
MVKVSVTYTRPSVNTPWHFEVIDMTAVDALAQAPAWADKHQGKSPQEIAAPGAASTTLDANTIWATEGDFEAFRATAEYQSYVAARDAYNTQNSITRSTETIEAV